MDNSIQSRGFSVITNFGCDRDCWYCIWKRHPLKDCKDTTDWKKLESALYLYAKYEGIKKVSVSGGGDPLYGDMSQPWLFELFQICKRLNLEVDIHTSFFPINYWTYNDNFKYAKVVLHLTYDRFCELKSEFTSKEISRPYEALRLAFVVTDNLTELQIVDIINFAYNNQFEVGFRELYLPDIPKEYVDTNFDDDYYVEPVKPLSYFERMKSWWENKELSYPGHKIKFIEQNDYNMYYMPDNKVYYDFMCKGPAITEFFSLRS